MSILSRAKKALKKSEEAPKKKTTEKKVVAEKKDAEVAAQDVAANLEMAQVIGLTPLLTEKGFRQQEKDTVVFRVRPFATKGQINAAVVEQFGVKPVSIRTAQYLPKTRRRGMMVGTTNAWKKAYVKVNDIHKILGSEE